MRRTLKICLVCAAWAAIGTQVALALNPWLWWIGLALGSLGGYLTCDWRTVLTALPIAARRATAISGEQWHRALRATGGIACWGASLALAGAAFAWLPFAVLRNTLEVPTVGEYVAAAITGTLMAICLQIVGVVFVWLVDRDSLPDSNEVGVGTFAYEYNPLILFGFHLPRVLLFHLVPALARGLAEIGLTAVKVLWHLYRLIHTEERWLCSVDVACGVAVGYWFASPLLGGLSGGAFWLVNRLLIAGALLRTLPVRVRS